MCCGHYSRSTLQKRMLTLERVQWLCPVDTTTDGRQCSGLNCVTHLHIMCSFNCPQIFAVKTAVKLWWALTVFWDLYIHCIASSIIPGPTWRGGNSPIIQIRKVNLKEVQEFPPNHKLGDGLESVFLSLALRHRPFPMYHVGAGHLATFPHILEDRLCAGPAEEKYLWGSNLMNWFSFSQKVTSSLTKYPGSLNGFYYIWAIAQSLGLNSIPHRGPCPHSHHSLPPPHNQGRNLHSLPEHHAQKGPRVAIMLCHRHLKIVKNCWTRGSCTFI